MYSNYLFTLYIPILKAHEFCLLYCKQMEFELCILYAEENKFKSNQISQFVVTNRACARFGQRTFPKVNCT